MWDLQKRCREFVNTEFECIRSSMQFNGIRIHKARVSVILNPYIDSFCWGAGIGWGSGVSRY
jgi:hypothetical protein